MLKSAQLLRLLNLLLRFRRIRRLFEKLQRKAELGLLDDHRLGTDLRELPVGEALARLEMKDLVRLVESEQRGLVIVRNYDSEKSEILRS